MLEIIQNIVNVGASVVLPVLLFIIGLLLGAKPRRAFTGAITVGIGYIGLNLVLGMLGDILAPATQAMVERFNLSLTTIDIGWPAASAISYGTILGTMAIPIGIIVNIVLLIFGLTKTLNVDVWNLWHGAFVGSLVYAVTGNFTLGIFTIISYMVLIYFIGDLSQPYVEKELGLPNISFPHGTSAPGFLIALPLNWIFDRIPGFNKLEADSDTIQKKFGVFGETTVMGLIIGIAIGLLANYSIGDTLNVGMTTAAVMYLMPKMVSFLMEGLTPISEAANEFVKKRFPDRELNVGMDSALAVGNQAVLSSSLILVPITLILAFVLPGNKTMPLGDIATIPYAIALMVPVFKGNIIRSVVGGTIYMVSILYTTSWVAPLVTRAAASANFDLAGNTSITALIEGGLWPTLVYVLGAQYLPWIISGLLLIIGLAGLYYVNKVKAQKNEQ